MVTAANEAPRFAECSLTMLMADMAGFSRAVGQLSAVEIAHIIDRFYVVCDDVVDAHGGRVVKCSGDNCLAVFAVDGTPSAVDCARLLRDRVRSLGEELNLDLDLGANLHIATVVEGEFGAANRRSYDIAGTGVIHVFRMGAGPGIRISEPVYRRLPNEVRKGWRKHQPPATYTLSA